MCRSYNNDYNNVDIIAQLHGTYQFNHWMWKRKWWWAIWMWGVQVLMVNAYILYKTSHLIIWHKDEKTLLSHYEFHRQLALAWVGSPEDAHMAGQKHSWDDASSTTSSGKSTRINDTTLDPLKGTLWMRLDDDSHYPVLPNAKRPCCRLCQWVETAWDKNKVISNVLFCDKCHVSLCVACFKPFHTISDVKKWSQK